MKDHDLDVNYISDTRQDVSVSGRMPDNYSRLMGALDGLPDVDKTKPSINRHVPPLGVGGVETFLVQSFWQQKNTRKEQPSWGQTIFLEWVSASGTQRLVLPAEVADIIARQRATLVARSHSRKSKAAAQARKDAGILPGFMQAKKSKAGS